MTKDASHANSFATIADVGTVGTARRTLAARFRHAGFPDAGLEARILIEAVAGRNAEPRSALSEEDQHRLEAFAARRLAGEPVWRILGERDFWGLTFALSPETLEPRPDTETLVEAALAAFAERRAEALSILDLGTGTGCLLIALLSEFPAASGVGVDIAAGAVATATANAERNGVGRRAAFQLGDWTQGLAGPFDLIVSNPPYIPSRDIAGLAVEVRDHDPLRALDGGPDGIEPYRRLAAELPRVLAPGGLVVLEIGAGQEDDVVAVMTAGGFSHLGSRADLGGHTRALLFSRGK